MKERSEDIILGVLAIVLVSLMFYGMYEVFAVMYKVLQGVYHLLNKIVDKF